MVPVRRSEGEALKASGPVQSFRGAQLNRTGVRKARPAWKDGGIPGFDPLFEDEGLSRAGRGIHDDIETLSEVLQGIALPEIW